MTSIKLDIVIHVYRFAILNFRRPHKALRMIMPQLTEQKSAFLRYRDRYDRY